jgi:choline-sulfatase
MFDPADSILPSTDFEVNEHLPWVFALAASGSPSRAAAAHEPTVRKVLALVRGLIRQIDDALGRLVAQLDLDSTILFFTSDHGDYAGHRGLMRKNPWIPFDDLARVPLVISGGGVPAGRRMPALVQSCDIALTCLDYAGVARPGGVEFDTRSLRPILEDVAEAADLDRAIYSATSLDWPMIRKGRYKYIKHVARGGVLFDLDADPQEHENLVLDPAFAELRADLAEQLRATMSQPVLDLPVTPNA